MTQKVDFEGYRVYLGRDERQASFSLVASYDKEDYDKWEFDPVTGQWRVWEDPFSLEQLRCLYGTGSVPCEDSSFLPAAYFNRSHLFHLAGFPDSVFYFTPHDYNTSSLQELTPISKTYPDMPDPRTLPADSITDDMYTEDGYLRFYEYELDINSLLATVSYYVSVTAFDFGSPTAGVAPLESDLTEEPVEAFPMHELDAPLWGSDKVYVYPNPYRIDANYRDLGFEGRAQDDTWDERVRSIWFANLPPKCTINIWTLDGDRVRTIEHDVPISDPTYSRERWDLINRNFQIIVSGLYYWTVEAPDKETQIGKLVILR